MTNYQ